MAQNCLPVYPFDIVDLDTTNNNACEILWQGLLSEEAVDKFPPINSAR